MSIPHLAVTQELADIYKPIRRDLDRFNELIREELASKDPLIASLTEYLLGISGKNLRPALAILSARLAGDMTDTSIRLGIAIELLHTATLIHDDIIDGSMYRRNQLSLNAKWGVEVSIICGDYLYAKAFSILSGLDDSNINRMFALCARTMCEGEMKQVETRKSIDMGEDAYLEIIRKKTASLFQAACAVGGYIAKQPAASIHALGEYGRNYGMAFQITDDCLDLIGKEKDLGKKAGLDFEKSDPTLPLIYLHQSLDAAGREGFHSKSFERIKEMAESAGIVDKCMARAREFGAAAGASIRSFPDGVYRKSLLDLVDYTLQRV